MNRRNFINNISLAGVSVLAFPYSGIANSSNSTLFKDNFGGIDFLSSFGTKIEVGKLDSLTKLKDFLRTNNCSLLGTEITKLTDSCYIIPIKKEHFFINDEITALIVSKNNDRFEYNIVSQELINEYNTFIKNYMKSIKSQDISSNTLMHFIPKKVQKNTSNEFSFSTKNANVSIKKIKNKTYTFIS